jgi:hypothetical protein
MGWRQGWKTESLPEVVDLVALRFDLVTQRCAFLLPDTERVLEIAQVLWQTDQRLLL